MPPLQITGRDGLTATTPQQAEELEAAGWHKCPYRRCHFFFSPETVSSIENNGGYFTCPKCHRSGDLFHELPWWGASDEQFDENYQAGGSTKIGLRMDEQAQIGEDLIERLGEIPGYGPITWWHQGGATSNSPLDGATKNWGIEVKTIGYDAIHHRFIPGRDTEKQEKNAQAAKMGLQGILAVLVMLDFRSSMADIYVNENPLKPWMNAVGRMQPGGVASFRRNERHLVASVPFKNPFTDPHNPSPLFVPSTQPTPDLGGDYAQDQPF